MHRILHVGLGPLGRIIVADLVERGLGRVVAAVDSAPDIAGKPLSTVVPKAGAGTLTVLPSLDAVTNWRDIDCALVTTSSDLAKCAPTLRDLLRRGVSIVSTCEELLFPWLRHDALAKELHDLAVKNKARLLGTGVNPGFLMDTLPVFATAVCKSVRSVHVWRIQDATTRRVPFQQKIGAGLDDQQFAAKIKDGSLRHVGLGESLHFISKYLGLGVTRWEESIEPVKAARDLTCALGPIPKGRSAGVRQVANGYAGDKKVITLEFQAAIGQDNPHDRVVIHGEPPLDLTLAGGVHGDIATSAITLNCIAPLLAAPPGLHTMATIPMGRFAPAHS
jgi:hypothetical protein